MDKFDFAVAEQLKTMDKLLFLQSEIERCQQVEQQLFQLQIEADKIHKLKRDIVQMKKDLKEVQRIFETQTEEAIRSYHLEESL
ncbi:YgaB family protein [Sutcliffiella deserti]|uniref:YgaB family protein n=1 Tax=Sutcliffiella deserti TaxID=2875501 RepID=UPI001CC0BCC2|nr:YgaB family protein [Sutcliffiella deserti]